jgi:flavodoxin I
VKAGLRDDPSLIDGQPSLVPVNRTREEKSMQTFVIYDSKFGNTERIAEAIGRGAGAFGDVRVMSTAEAGITATLVERPDLLLLGGPTQKRGPSPALRAFMDDLPGPLRGIPAASFDTRYRGPLLLMGSAAACVAKVIAKSGAQPVAPPESFFMERGGPMERQQLEPGEVQRAEQWGGAVAAAAARRNGVSDASH